MVRILRFHRGGSGSNPGMGRLGAAKSGGGDYATEQDVGDIKGSQRQDVHGEYGNLICQHTAKILKTQDSKSY